ncbi:helix-turn-helix domain-containing protein [Nocardia seriolae]|uniref:helix-turn-helix domain-containing protein n=1 Tax=Nocardia seriolae TaxID=37332 RepID=UPI00051A5663|nr:helix-turn-helix transcriptional regulator [Nocardia seriolae]MTJ64272.1 helix-turn-helix domain-containing protein [Nocardia seriolae]MTJ72874.1 helix-turn-helix domain-containing protein [Nocardia seriolae]MTJ89263.1 helix-turn-helix domain-containing protein [Nocardia seriolae]MTK33241.1 helix-turn-helix domain-containing protein [Nocardia seriolae]MTK40564.1 helix-turn-helix domain-containing protein [Nocardia seriolae]
MANVGQRIAAERKIAGLGQRQLATRANYSLSMIKKVEQGTEPASTGLISAVAKALRITPEHLTGAPYDDGKPLSDAVNGLTTLLAEGRYARAIEPGPLARIEADLEAAQQLYRTDRTRQTLEVLPDLIRRIHGAVRDLPGTDQTRAYTLLTSAYVLAEWAARRTGHMMLALPARDLADGYAPLADDPTYGALSALARARVLTHYGESGVAGQLIDSAIATADSSNAGLVLAGYSHLAGAVNEARKLNYPGAVAHIDAARELSTRTGETDLYMTAFGPLNVEIHAHAIELESGDPNRAAREGASLTHGPDAPPTRVAHHWQDNARAWLMSGKPDRALAALNKARAAAPQQTRLHPAVRETLHGIAAAEKRRTETLTGFASWLGTSV